MKAFNGVFNPQLEANKHRWTHPLAPIIPAELSHAFQLLQIHQMIV